MLYRFDLVERFMEEAIYFKIGIDLFFGFFLVEMVKFAGFGLV